jgi:hypothetical protein
MSKNKFFLGKLCRFNDQSIFIMLVLFVLDYCHDEKRTQNNSRTIKIVEIQNSVKELDKRYFLLSGYKRFSLKKQIQFDPAKVL